MAARFPEVLEIDAICDSATEEQTQNGDASCEGELKLGHVHKVITNVKTHTPVFERKIGHFPQTQNKFTMHAPLL